MKEWYLVNSGRIVFPEDFSRIFSSDGKYLISRFYGGDYYFEMSGESMYCAIKGLEADGGGDYSEYRRKIVQAITDRMKVCNGILYHTSLVPGKTDTQLRATNSAIRVLIQAHLDGYNVHNELERLLEHHFQYYMEWGGGVWFCHDQSEYEKHIRRCQLQSKAWNKETYNTLTLNTHLDSLNTLMILYKHKGELHINDQEHYDELLKRGTVALNALVSKKTSGPLISCLQYIDKWFCLLNKQKNPVVHFFVRAFDRFVHPLFFKKLTPVFFFNYGYVARDLAVKSRHIDYLPANIADLLRFYSLVQNSPIVNDTISLQKIHTIIDKAVGLLFKLDTFYQSENDIAWKCEIKYLSGKLKFDYSFPKTWDAFTYSNFTVFC